MVMPARKSTPAPRSARAKHATPGRTTTPVRASGTAHPLLVAAGLVLVIASAAVMAAHRPPRPDTTIAEAPAEAVPPAVSLPLSPVILPVSATIEASAQAAAPAASPQLRTADLSAEPSPLETTRTLAVNVSSDLPAAIPDSAPAVAEPDIESPEPVSISGCLELDQDTFWLKETDGADAPTSRSWRSGFLRRRTAAVELPDLSRAFRPQNYVGQRVIVTGTLTGRSMRVEALRRLEAPCS
jgi:hypothetical protein